MNRGRIAFCVLMVSVALCLIVGRVPAQDAPVPPPALETSRSEAPPASQVVPAPASEPSAEGYGLSKAQAIEVCDPQGQQQYLARLLCPDSRHPEFARAGNVGPRQDIPENASEEQMDAMMLDMFKPRRLAPGEPDFHIVDAYEVACGEQVTVLYLDMYHCAQERPDRAPAGFTIID